MLIDGTPAANEGRLLNDVQNISTLDAEVGLRCAVFGAVPDEVRLNFEAWSRAALLARWEWQERC